MSTPLLFPSYASIFPRKPARKNGRDLFNFLLAQGSKNLAKIDVQQPRVDLSRTSDIDVPQWLSEDRVFYKSVRDCARPRIVIGQAETADERIAPFMAGG